MRRFILFLNVLAVIVLIVLCFAGHVWWGLGFLFFANLLWLRATLKPTCGWWGEVVTHFETEKREVWLTIDDGPDAMETPGLLSLLEENEAKATFFFIGHKAKRQAPLVAEVMQLGFEVANHTQHHPAGTFWLYGPRHTKEEVAWCSDALRKITGIKPRWFRAPAGLRNHCLHPVLQREKLRLISWSARGLDGVKCDPDVALARIKKRVKPGAIIVIHEGRGTAVALLRDLLEWLHAEGYSCVLPSAESLR